MLDAGPEEGSFFGGFACFGFCLPCFLGFPDAPDFADFSDPFGFPVSSDMLLDYTVGTQEILEIAEAVGRDQPTGCTLPERTRPIASLEVGA